MWRIKSKSRLSILVACGLASLYPAIAFATTSIQTEVCAQFTSPTITAPPTGKQTDNSSITVNGMGQSNMVLSVTRNGTNASTTTVAPDGSYAVTVPLSDGNNVLIAREVNGCDTIKESAAVTVYRTTLVQPPAPSGGSVVPPQTSGGQQPVVTLLPGASPLNYPITSVPDTPTYPRPTIISPTQGEIFYTSHLWVTGKAQPGSLVTVYVNTISVARVIASEDGLYGTSVGLDLGANTIQVRARLDDKVATSDLVDVTYIQQTTTPRSDSVLPKIIIAIIVSLLLTLFIVWCIRRIRRKLE